MKDHSMSLSATMGMDSAAKALNVQQDLKGAELNAIVERDFTHKNKNFSSLPTARYTHQRAESIIKQIHDRKNLYSARRVGDRCFQVYYIGDMADVLRAELNTCKDLSGEVPVPLFSRIRTVTVDDYNIMRCSCSSFESCGLFCTHCVVVAEAVFASQDKTFYGFTHHDCDMIYHSAYLHLAYRDTTPFQISRAYNRIAKEKKAGPKLRTKIPSKDVMTVKAPERILPAIQRLKNFKPDDIDLSSFEMGKGTDGMMSQTFEPTSLSQNDIQLVGGADNNDETFDNVQPVEAYKDTVKVIQIRTSEQTSKMFSESLDDTNFPGDVMNNLTTREILKQKWEESCALADQVGQEQTEILSDLLDKFKIGCQEAKSKTLNNALDDGDGSKRKHIGMAGAEYTGTQKRVKITHGNFYK